MDVDIASVFPSVRLGSHYRTGSFATLEETSPSEEDAAGQWDLASRGTEEHLGLSKTEEDGGPWAATLRSQGDLQSESQTETPPSEPGTPQSLTTDEEGGGQCEGSETLPTRRSASSVSLPILDEVHFWGVGDDMPTLERHGSSKTLSGYTTTRKSRSISSWYAIAAAGFSCPTIFALYMVMLYCCASSAQWPTFAQHMST